MLFVTLEHRYCHLNDYGWIYFQDLPKQKVFS